ncbi:MAG: hypothetical protein AB8I08_15335 [Sandaracinaceae bacterium]
MRRLLAPLLLLTLGCAGEEGALCGEGLDPVVVTGLSGTVEGVPSVEVLLRVPDTCTSVDRTWMFWEDSTETVMFGDEPTGVLMRGEVDAGDADRRIFFRDVNVGVRLDYPDDIESPTVEFVWFANGMDLGSAPCRDDAGMLVCGAP